MKILHLTNTAYPWFTGGKEIYADSLVNELNLQNVDNAILIHQTDRKEPIGVHKKGGNQVIVVPPIVAKDKDTDTFTREVSAMPGFKDFVIDYKPDIVHFHDQNHGSSINHLRLIRDLGIKTILTYHTPGQSCPQRGLLYHNKVPCDGELRVFRCTECQLKSLKIPSPFNYIASTHLFSKAEIFPSGKLKKALQRRELTKCFIRSFHEFYNTVDAIHVYAEWARKMLLLNNVDPEKIHFFRTGGKERYISDKRTKKFPDRKELRLVYLGRCEPIKGIHILIKAVKMMDSTIPVKVFFLSTKWDVTSYGRKLLNSIDGDDRFVKPELIPNEELQDHLATMDACIIPSLWLETGPITVFDAFSAGLPVIGSNLGGICELVRNGKDGLLFEPGNSGHLKKVLDEVVSNNSLLTELGENIRENRTMKDVAVDMISLYEKL